MRVTLLESRAGNHPQPFAQQRGERIELPTDEALALIAAGQAEACEAPDATPTPEHSARNTRARSPKKSKA